MRTRLARIVLVLGLALFGLTATLPAAAAPADTDLRTPINTEVPIPVQPGQVPGSTAEKIADYLTVGRVEDLAQYIGIIYNFLISIVGMVAAVAMIVGGFQYLTSAGDAGKIGAAKSKMANAFIGLVLALGSYTILNTINPNLLRLKVPNVAPVKTELFTLPVCEDIMAGDPATQRDPAQVTPAGGSTECGYVGKYGQGNAIQYCIYSGSCRLVDAVKGQPSFGQKTCVQRAGMEPTKVRDALKTNPNSTFAECLACGDFTIQKAQSFGFDLETSCEAWMGAFAKLPGSLKTYRKESYEVQNGLFAVCYPRDGRQGCVGMMLNCWDITRDDDTLGDDEGYVATGCEGYDEDPWVVWASKWDSNGVATEYTRGNKPEDYPKHLATLCANNPCVNYLDPKTNLQPFLRGCKSGTGIAYRAQRVVRFGDIAGTDDCRNQ